MRGLLIILLFSLFFAGISASMSDIFDEWCEKYRRSYHSPEEKAYRFKVFRENYDIIIEHNSKKDSSFTVGLNDFSDLTDDEFKTMYGTLDGFSELTDDEFKTDGTLSLLEKDVVIGLPLEEESELPSSVDWRMKGAVTEVKKQGTCGCCWLFSVVAAIEGIHQINTGSLVSLSVQELVDCEKSVPNTCRGGRMSRAFEFVIKNGIASEEDYPYVESQGTCNQEKLKKRVATIDGYVFVIDNEKSLFEAVAKQPVSILLCGTDDLFRTYTGVSIERMLWYLLQNHAVLVIGYDTTGSQDYWIIKNSWGKHWGMDGYMHILRSSKNSAGVCGMNMMALYPVKFPTPSPIEADEEECCYCKEYYFWEMIVLFMTVKCFVVNLFRLGPIFLGRLILQTLMLVCHTLC